MTFYWSFRHVQDVRCCFWEYKKKTNVIHFIGIVFDAMCSAHAATTYMYIWDRSRVKNLAALWNILVLYVVECVCGRYDVWSEMRQTHTNQTISSEIQYRNLFILNASCYQHHAIVVLNSKNVWNLFHHLFAFRRNDINWNA